MFNDIPHVFIRLQNGEPLVEAGNVRVVIRDYDNIQGVCASLINLDAQGKPYVERIINPVC